VSYHLPNDECFTVKIDVAEQATNSLAIAHVPLSPECGGWSIEIKKYYG
jgi:hypothetical protein